MKKLLFPLIMLLVSSNASAQIQIAFISDAHVQDVTGHPELVRSQEVQVQSTRLFNENYFAFCSALDDCGRKGIKTVVLPGDITDNGQLVNHHAVRDVLNRYAKKYGMSFFVTFGNHDPSRPFDYDNAGSDFLAADGSRIAISSKPQEGAVFEPLYKGTGIEEQTSCYADFGFFPKEDYRFWATPFSTYTADEYSFAKAKDEAAMQNRRYALNDTLEAFDASYVVEPVEGVWIMSLDGSVYQPKGMKDGKTMEYNGSELGYNNIISGRRHLIGWVKTIVEEAKKRGKALITFSHYPLVDFNDGTGKFIAQSWGATKFDLARSPSDAVTDSLMRAGLRLHFAGHMHVNDTGVKTDGDNTLVNVQCPSTALYVPAYKILTVNDASHYEVRTVVLSDVPGYDSLFPRYKKEYEWDIAHGKQPQWSIEALQSKTYIEFCDWHFRDLTRLRFIPRDIPETLRKKIIGKNGIEILHEIDADAKGDARMKSWGGFELMLDLYRLRYAGELARRDITDERLKQYDILFDAAEKAGDDNDFIAQMRSLARMFHSFLNEEPAINFLINLGQ